MENDDILKEAVYSPFVLEFLTVAQKYCLFIEEIGKYEKPEIMVDFPAALGSCYLCALEAMPCRATFGLGPLFTGHGSDPLSHRKIFLSGG